MVEGDVPPAAQSALDLTPGLRKRAGWLRALLALTAVASVGTAAHEAMMLELIRRLDAGAPGVRALADMIDLAGAGVGVFLLASYISTLVAYCFWVNRAARVGRRVAPGVVKVSPAAAVGWNFVPIANLIMPFQAVRQIWMGSFGVGPVSPGARAIGSVGLVWWLAWVASNVASNVSMRMGGWEPTLEDLRVTTPLDLFSSVTLIVASLALRNLVKRLTRQQVQVADTADVFA